MGQKLINSEVSAPVEVKLNKSIKKEGVNGLMTFGIDNDYPQIMEKIVEGSTTAKSVANVYSKFLSGQGFENELINDIRVGTDSRGKKITLRSLLRQVSESAVNNGYYIHCNYKLNGLIKDVHLKPFKCMRIAKPDETGYSAMLLFSEDWTKKKQKEYKEFNVFNLDSKVFAEQVKKAGGIENYKGQIYFQYLNDTFFYPTHLFESVYLDCDTENQISLYKNRQIRNGFTDKIVFRIAPGGTQEEQEELADKIKAFIGPDGDTVLVLEDDLNDESGEVKENGSFRIDKIENNIHPDLFTNIEKGLVNNIRKSGGGIPANLIDYEESKLGGTSGEAIIQSVNYYNSITDVQRELISESFKEIFSNFDNEILRNNTNWKIKPLNLAAQEFDGLIDEIEEPENVNELAQASLRGSVGGVQGILQIQQGVTSGTTDRNAAIEILKEIYGFTQEKAEAILGNPKEQEQDGITDDNTATIN